MNRDNLVIPQGATYGVAWPIVDDDGNDVNLAGWSARSQVRTKYYSDTVLHEWSTTAGNADVADSRVTLTVDPDTSTAWDWDKGVYDVELVDPGGQVYRIAEGTITVSPEVTR